MNERAPNHETGPESSGEFVPAKRQIDPEFAKKLGRTAMRDEVEDPARTAQVERMHRDIGRTALRGDRTSARDRPPGLENRERS